MTVDADVYFVLPNARVPVGAGAESMGSKAYGLLRLAGLGLSVPPAFVLGTAVCRDYFARGAQALACDLRESVKSGLARLEECTGRRFADVRRPLLLSVRSGAAASMPGMLETILNVGLCERTVRGLLRATGNPRLVWDCYRRLVRDFMGTVHGAPAAQFEQLVERHRLEQGLADTSEIDSSTWKTITGESLELARALTGRSFPEDPFEQVMQAVEAVFNSWNAPKACQYRRINGLDESAGTAVTLQAMVFGNSGGMSGAGVGFTRDPASGANHPYIDFRFNAQGEDVVSGRHAVAGGAERLARQLPHVAGELQRVCDLLESEFRDMQDFEFTVENGRLHILQTRTGQRSAWAALRIAVDMVHEGLIQPAEALRRLDGISAGLERQRIGAVNGVLPIATAVPAGMGVAAGTVMFDVGQAVSAARQGRHVILVRPDVETKDIEGIAACDGILTSSGGRTSHAAVVARQLNKVCLVGCTDLKIDPDGTGCSIAGIRFTRGSDVTLDGDTGNIYSGLLPLVHERPDQDLAVVSAWRASAAEQGAPQARSAESGRP